MNIPTPAEVHAVAVRRGQYDDYDGAFPPMVAGMRRIMDEADEAYDAALSGHKSLYSHELADIILTTLSVAHHLGIDIETAIREKHEINIKRAEEYETKNKAGD